MLLAIREIHAAPSRGALNEEWFVLENTSDKPFSTSGCAVQVGKTGMSNKRLRQIGTLDPGFTLAPGEKKRVVTGHAGKKGQGKPPEDAVTNYHLFQGDPLLAGAGTIVALLLKQHEIARATFEPSAKDGILPTKNGA